MSLNFQNIFLNYTPYINGSERYKKAAVILPFVTIDTDTVKPTDNIYILFEKRAKNLRTHPGQICFPGGRIELNETPLQAALRESFEELNLKNDSINIITPLDLFISPFNVLIHPFLAEIHNIDSIIINPSEVEEIVYIPLSFFLETEPQRYTNAIQLVPNDDFPYEMVPDKKNHQFDIGSYEILFYDYNGIIIWGLTARILHNFICYFKANC